LISILLEIKIVHIFPIRRHSYNICDTNFATIGTQFKRKSVLETPNDYLKIIEERKKFKVVKTPVLDFENCFNNHIIRENSVKISLVHRIDYFPNGEVIFSDDFELGNNKVNLIKTNSDLIKSSINDIKTVDKSFLSKIRLRILCHYFVI